MRLDRFTIAAVLLGLSVVGVIGYCDHLRGGSRAGGELGGAR